MKPETEGPRSVCSNAVTGMFQAFFQGPSPCGRNWVLARAVPPQSGLGGARPRRNQKELAARAVARLDSVS
jgi:hypothetical protein